MAVFAARSQQPERRFAQHERPSSLADGVFFSDVDPPTYPRTLPRPGSSVSHFRRASSSSWTRALSPRSDADASQDAAPTLPGGTAALISTVVFLSVLLFLFGGWRYYVWRKKNRILPSLEGLWPPPDEKADGKRPGATVRRIVLMPPIPSSPSVAWAPAKLSPWVYPTPPERPPKARLRESNGTNSGIEKPTAIEPNSRQSLDRLQNKMLPSESLGMDTKRSQICEYINQHVTPMSPPIKSPTRSVSLKPKAYNISRKPSLKLFTVIHSFPVNLEDEVAVKEGDFVQVLQEFKDGWVRGRKLGLDNVVEGMIPKCCLTIATPRSKP